ncbi:aldose reductase-related protein 2 [Aethina tumida]|uniref:aldose reductase-related protein 2 n=1 Tax=Aethina tumida TaxID=116153 RepID=UPI00096B1951|nr:aldose reductase-related protein 2 [Aethina tumida]
MAAKIFMDLPGGLKMPAIGLGTWQATDEEELAKALDAALEVGYRHIDTAFVYNNELIIGKVLKKWFESGKLKREDLFITTKLPMFAVKAEKVEELLTTSLKNLGLDYVDLYLIHFPVCLRLGEGETFSREAKSFETEVTDHIAVWKKMEEQVDAGRTKTIGISNFNKRQIENILKSNPRIRPANLQVELHVYLQQQDLVHYCLENGITVTAYSPLGSPGLNKFLESLGKPTKPLPDMLHDEKIKQIASKHKKSNAQIMLRYLIQRSIIVIPKSVTPARLQENIEIFDFALDAEDMDTLNSLEVGESARVCDFKMFPGLEKNAEWPFE